jgi:hypothetical protein
VQTKIFFYRISGVFSVLFSASFPWISRPFGRRRLPSPALSFPIRMEKQESLLSLPGPYGTRKAFPFPLFFPFPVPVLVLFCPNFVVFGSFSSFVDKITKKFAFFEIFLI